MNYSNARDAYSHRARGSSRKKLSHNTWLWHNSEDRSFSIHYHGNRLISLYPDNTVSFHSLGWITSPTTMTRIRDYSPLTVDRGYYRLRDWDSIGVEHFFVHLDNGKVLPLVEDVPYDLNHGNKDFFGPLCDEDVLALDGKLRKYAMNLAIDLFHFRLDLVGVEPLPRRTPYEDIRVMVEHQVKSGALVNAAVGTSLNELDKTQGWLWRDKTPTDAARRLQWIENRMKGKMIHTSITRMQAERMLVQELHTRLWFNGSFRT